jgi:hypothetical protein
VTDIDLAKFFIPTFMAIAMAKVSMSAAEARANGFWAPATGSFSTATTSSARPRKKS